MAALTTLRRALEPAPVALIGATALLARLDAPLSETTDLDLAVVASSDEIEVRLGRLGGWSRDAELEFRWIAPGAGYVDVLPSGRRESNAGFVQWRSGRRMSLVGFRHVFADARSIELADGFEWPVPRVPVLALLKMAAYEDRPHDRERDLGDLVAILEHYLPPDDPRRFDPRPGISELPFEYRGSFILGEELARLVDDGERAVVEAFARRILEESDGGRTQVLLMRKAPSSWGEDPEAIVGRVAAMMAGLQTH